MFVPFAYWSPSDCPQENAVLGELTQGGALFVQGGKLQAVSTVLRGNWASFTEGSGGGGGLFVAFQSHVALETCTFINNRYWEGGFQHFKCLHA